MAGQHARPGPLLQRADRLLMDAAGEDELLDMTGVAITLLGTADAATLTRWFDALAEGGQVLDPLQERPWDAHDGQVRDRFGVRWLIGYEHAAQA